MLITIYCGNLNIIVDYEGCFLLPYQLYFIFVGEHILAFACCIGNEEIISMLIKAGANIHAQDSFGKGKIYKNYITVCVR